MNKKWAAVEAAAKKVCSDPAFVAAILNLRPLLEARASLDRAYGQQSMKKLSGAQPVIEHLIEVRKWLGDNVEKSEVPECAPAGMALHYWIANNKAPSPLDDSQLSELARRDLEALRRLQAMLAKYLRTTPTKKTKKDFLPALARDIRELYDRFNLGKPSLHRDGKPVALMMAIDHAIGIGNETPTQDPDKYLRALKESK